MKKYLLLGLVTFLLASCSKDRKMHSITYRVVENTTANPVFTVSYTDSNGNTQSLGSLTGASWSSETVQRKAGEFVTMNLSSQDPSGGFDFYIYSDGNIIAQGTMTNPNGNASISADVPD